MDLPVLSPERLKLDENPSFFSTFFSLNQVPGNINTAMGHFFSIHLVCSTNGFIMNNDEPYLLKIQRFVVSVVMSLVTIRFFYNL